MVRRVSLFSLAVLLLGAVSWQPPISSTPYSLLLAEASVKNADANSDEPAPLPEGPQGIGSQKEGDDGVKPNAPWPIGGGDANFPPSGTYNCAGTTYTYTVVNGPPNVCGTLNMVLNGVPTTGGGWICTDANGSATKGPWTVTQDKTATNSYIQWPDGTRTSGGETKIDDYSQPQTYVNAGAPYSFSGSATDAQWGSGFSSWTTVLVRFRNKTTGLYWNGSGYGAFSPVDFVASKAGAGTSITWSISPPPPSHHVSGQQYEWCARANDRCSYSVPACASFTY